jgi:flagellar motor switch protein FliM
MKDVQPYNFTKPGRLASDLEQRLGVWLRGTCSLAPKKWAKQLPYKVEMAFQEVDSLRPPDALARLPEAAVGYRVNFLPGGTPTLLSLPRPLVLALVAGMLGDPGGELPPDRELTVVEDSLCEYMVHDLLVAALQETWTGAAGIRLQMGPKETNPRWSRILPADDNVILCTFTLTGPFGEQPWHWLLARKGLLEEYARSGQPVGAPEAKGSRLLLEAVVRELPVAVSVCLGSVELPLSQLARLREGDLVILNQRVTEPLTALISGERKFRGWPGRVGSAQAFEIDSLIDS